MDYKREAAQLIERSHIVELVRRGCGKARWAADNDDTVLDVINYVDGEEVALLDALHEITPSINYSFELICGGYGVDLVAITDERERLDNGVLKPYLLADVYQEIWQRYGIKTTAAFHGKPGERVSEEVRENMLEFYERFSKMNFGGSSDGE